MRVPKFLLPAPKNWILGPKTAKFGPKLAFWAKYRHFCPIWSKAWPKNDANKLSRWFSVMLVPKLLLTPIKIRTGVWIPPKSDHVIYDKPLDKFTTSDFTFAVRRPNQTLSSLTDIFEIFLWQVSKKTYYIRFVVKPQEKHLFLAAVRRTQQRKETKPTF